MLRTRDWVALGMAVFLARLCWMNGGSNGMGGGEESSLTASIHMSWYLPRHDSSAHSHIALPPAVLDVNGDGVGETLAVLASNREQPQQQEHKEEEEEDDHPIQWKIQILDLKPGMVSAAARRLAAPFLPQTLLTSPGLTLPHDVEPLQLTTGHVDQNPSRDTKTSSSSSSSSSNAQDSGDRTLHYFCGTDWHDASEKCAVPCPSGTTDECPEGERCFADTPCLERKKQSQHQHASSRGLMIDPSTTTPAGSWPSIVTLWSDGVVRMHSLVSIGQNETDPGEGRRYKSNQPPLQVDLVWETPLFHSVNHSVSVTRWHHSHITFLEGGRVPVVTNNHVMVTGTVQFTFHNPNHSRFSSPLWETIVMALDSKTGEVLWDSFAENKELAEALSGANDAAEPPLLLPVQRGVTSYARRRSHNPNLFMTSHADAGTPEANCMKTYRRSLLTSPALPFLIWTAQDIRSHAIHVDHQHGQSQIHHAHHHHHKHSKTKRKVLASSRHGSVSQQKVVSKPKGNQASGNVISRVASSVLPSWLQSMSSKTAAAIKRKRHGRRHHSASSLSAAASHAKYGRPNVVVTHNREGLQVRSLKNGRALCHLSLWEETLYSDLNHDGILDSVNIITAQHPIDEDDDVDSKWISDLARRVAPQLESVGTDHEGKAQLRTANLCHLQALSGLPSKEELFSTNVCGPLHLMEERIAAHRLLQAAPPLAVEPTRSGAGRRRGHQKRGHDVIVGLNSGVVTRVDGSSGRIQWQLFQFQHAADYPKWQDEEIVALQQIDSTRIRVPSARPIVLTGENGLSIVSAAHGTLLTTIKFPQMAVERPLLMDINGDGTTDIVVGTADAWWAYPVHIRTGASAVTRIVAGLLLMGMMLALLRNRFGPQPGKRSTDA